MGYGGLRRAGGVEAKQTSEANTANEMNEANRQKVAMRVMPWGLGSRVLGLTRSGERRAVVDEPMGVVRVAPEHTRVKPRSTKRKRVEV